MGLETPGWSSAVAPGRVAPTANPLTPREVDVLQLVAQGLGNQEIADKLFIGEATVRSQ
jgi:DNA-binding NarL/FixJ family response regulator